MSEMEPRRHSAPELLAAFVDGALVGSELAEVAAHLRQCRDCRDIAGEVARFKEEEEKAAAARAPKATKREWWIAAAVAAVLVAVFIPLRGRLFDPLVRVQAGQRGIEARLTGLDYAPYRPTRSGEEKDPPAKQSAAAASLQAELEKEHNARNLDRYAQAELALGRTQHALDHLNEALPLDPNNPTILSDLAAAQIAAGKVADAAENAARALERDPSLAAAAFNWALALEKLSNNPAAIKAWEKYLTLDSSSKWADEAREHLGKLKAPKVGWEEEKTRLRLARDPKIVQDIVRQFPQRARYWVQDELLPNWAANRDNDGLSIARAIAEARAADHDPFLLDLVNQTSSAPRAECSDALRRFGEGREALVGRRITEADSKLREAALRLQGVNSPLAIAAEGFLASIDFYQGRSDAALSRLASAEQRYGSELERYPTLAAEFEWSRALVLYRLGRPNDSLNAYRRGLERARSVHETETEVALASLMSGLLDTIGDRDEVERYRMEVLRRLADIGSPPQRAYIAFSQAAYAELRAKRPRVANAFIESQIVLAHDEQQRTGDSLLLAETELERGLVARDQDQLDAASDSVDRARTYAAQVKAEGLRDRVSSDIDYISGLLIAKKDPRRAVAEFDAALATWQRYHWNNRTAYGRLARGEAHMGVGNRRAAEDDFRAGLDVMEDQRRTLDEPPLRVAYFERSASLFVELIDLLLDEGRSLEALEVSERRRARDLLDRVTTLETRDAVRSAVPLRASEIMASIPKSTTLIEYAVLDKRTVIWTVGGGVTTCAKINIAASEIGRSAQAFAEGIAADDSNVVRREGRRLYDILVRPELLSIAPNATLVLIPDAALETIPFASLIAPNNQFLVETNALACAPSATIFVRSLAVEPDVESIVAVAEPAPTPSLPRLTRAIDEVNGLSRGYKRAKVLIGSSVTPAGFLDAARTCGVVHFAGHGVINRNQPAKSALLFEQDGRSDAALLDAASIAEFRLIGSPLVVLAACRTADGASHSSGATGSLACAFLSAGARGVVAALWDVDDQSTIHFSTEFHRRLQRGEAASSALREAQLQMLRSSNATDRRPVSWAGLTLIGTI